MSSDYIDDIIDYPNLIGFVRDQTYGDLPFEGLFPIEEVDDVEYALTQIPAFAGDVAHYRAWDTVPSVGKRPAISIVGGEIPPLGLSYKLTEREVIELNSLKAALVAQGAGGVVDRIYNDGLNTAGAIANRVTLGHADCLQTWNVTLTELGNVESGNAVTTNVAVPSGHNTAPAGAAWSNHSSAVPITDLLAWEKKFRHDTRGNPDGWMISDEVMSDLALNDQVRNQFIGSTGVAPAVLNAEYVQQAVKLAGVKAPLIVVDEERPALDGSGDAALLGARKVIATAQGMGATMVGPTAAASNLALEKIIPASMMRGVIAYVQRFTRPHSVMTTAEGTILPIVKDPNKLLVASV